MSHSSHPESPAGSTDVRDDLDIQHHAAVFVIQDVAVNNKLADITVVVRADMHLVVVFDKDGVTKDVIKAAVLTSQLFLGVGEDCRLTSSVAVED